MKIIKCHIENFGKLSNFDYVFDSNINTINEENGFGKTTFASFIKAMFYGMDAKRNTKNLIDRKKYLPWQGGNFGGNIEFEINNKKYKLERFFGKKENEDTFKLYDLETNLESNDYTQNIGEEIFKINKEAYERSTFISGQNMETSMNDSINAKLGNILESENDVESSDKAIKALDNALKNYKKTGGRGEIDKKRQEKAELEKKLEKSKIDEKNLEERKNKNEEIKKKIILKNEEQKNLEKILALKIEEETKNAKMESYNTIKENVQKSKEMINEYNNFFKDQVPTDEELSTLVEMSLSLEKYKLGKNDSNNFEKQLQEIEEKISSLKKDEQNIKTDKLNYVVMIVSILIFIIGICLCIKNSFVFAIPAIIVGIIGFVFSLIKQKSIKENIIKNKNITEEIETINKQKESMKKEKEEKQKEEENKIKELDESIKQYLMQYFESLNESYIYYIQDIQLKKKDFERQMNEYNERLKKQEEYEKENNINKLKENQEIDNNLNNINKSEIEEKIEILKNEISSLNDEKNYNKNQIELLESNLDTVYDTENELEEINQNISDMEEQYEILNATKNYLEIAKNKFSSQYLGDMKKSFIQNLEFINGEEIDASIDVNLNVQINEKGSNKELNYFSTGITDLIYICMRLSLIDALFKEEKPFIILDDPFVNLDESKMKNAINLINKISEKYQIIYFICHESRNIK